MLMTVITANLHLLLGEKHSMTVRSNVGLIYKIWNIGGDICNNIESIMFSIIRILKRMGGEEVEWALQKRWNFEF